MKRDMDFIRHLLTYVEEQPAGSIIQADSLIPKFSTQGGMDAPTIGEHVALLIEQGLIEGRVYDVAAPLFVVQRLTWEGHDFLQAIQNDTVWKKILVKAKELGGSMTLELAKELGKKYLIELAAGP